MHAISRLETGITFKLKLQLCVEFSCLNLLGDSVQTGETHIPWNSSCIIMKDIYLCYIDLV